MPSISFDGIARERILELFFNWYGLVLAALLGLASAAYYVDASNSLRPLFDDSYISLTFARNLAAHGKLSFDGVHWSTGATSPLHVTILAAFLKVGFAPFFATMAVGVLSQIALTIGVYLMTWAIFRTRLAAILGAVAISVTPYIPLDAGNGLETNLFLALISFAVASYLLLPGPRWRLLTGAIIALAVLTRPEGIALMPAFVVYRWIERQAGEPLSEFLLDAARLAVPGVLAFGALSLYALIVSGSVGGTASAKLRFFQENEQPLRDKVAIASDQIGLFLGPVVVLAGLAILAIRRREAALFGLFWIPVLVGYADFFPGGLNHYFYRYQHPALPFIAAFAGGGAAMLLSLAARRDFVVRALVAVSVIIVVVGAGEEYVYWHGIYHKASNETKRDLESMALDLNTIVRPDQTLAAHDIGAVGYYADYKILDLVGLVNHDVLQYHDGRNLRRYVELMKPDYILLFPDWDDHFLQLGVATDPQHYELVKTYPGGEIRPQAYMLYRVHYN